LLLHAVSVRALFEFAATCAASCAAAVLQALWRLISQRIQQLTAWRLVSRYCS
jgi:hypothetical protein